MESKSFRYQSATSPIAPEKLQSFGRFLSENIFEQFDLRDFLDTCLSVQKMNIQWAELQSEIVAVKIGYEKDPLHFYSWVGGVSAEHRGKGLASALMKRQHEWCRERGFKVISTKTMNRWKDMLIMNIKEGFEIRGTQIDKNGQLKIVMAKSL
jgi:GNAT superfamily N-acetyltransferase